MKRFFSMLAVLTFAFASMYGQESATNAYKGKFMNKDLRIQANIDFYNQSISVPGFELDSCYGFVQGRINGVWIILKVKDVGKKKAVVRAASENGSEAVDLEFSITEDGLSMRQIDDVCIKGIEGRKYVKLPKDLELKRQE